LIYNEFLHEFSPTRLLTNRIRSLIKRNQNEMTQQEPLAFAQKYSLRIKYLIPSGNIIVIA